MTVQQQVITILMVVLGTMLTRFLPFLIFPADEPTPKYIQYLGKVLPGKPWDTGADFSNFNCGSAFLETTDVALHSRRDDLLYGFSTDCFLRGKQSFLVV